MLSQLVKLLVISKSRPLTKNTWVDYPFLNLDGQPVILCTNIPNMVLLCLIRCSVFSFIIVCADKEVTSMSFIMLVLRILFLKAVAFNVLMTLRLWIH